MNTPHLPENPGAGCAQRLANANDEPFLRHLFAQTHPSLQALPAELRPQLAAMQFAGRAFSYAAQHPNAEDWILLDATGTPIGRHLVARTPLGYHCVDIAILPTHQNHGHATAALRHVQTLTAALKGAGEFTLSVNKDNPAHHLYLRLGFLPIAEDDLAYHMKWSATDPAPLH